MGKWQLCGLTMMKNGAKFKHGIVHAVCFLTQTGDGALMEMGASGRNLAIPPV